MHNTLVSMLVSCSKIALYTPLSITTRVQVVANGFAVAAMQMILSGPPKGVITDLITGL